MLRRASKWISLAVLPLLAISASASSDKEDLRQSLAHDGRHMELQISHQFTPDMQHNIVAWIDFISAALLQVYGRWPRHHWQISVTPTSAGDDPIPWAQVHRDDINRVEFFTAADASTDTLKQAWTGYHELAHLLIPYQGWGDAWFSEGLASYYQNILQARAGILTEQQMWQKLYDGYQRARLETQFDGISLGTVSDKLRQNGGFMRVYWSGAWYFLAADSRLRQQSGGRYSLDQALEKLNLCCGEEHMAVPKMVQQLDELNRVLLFRPLYDEVRSSLQVPPYEPIFASMGISVADGQVQLQQEGPGARLRRQIVARKPL